MSGVTGEFDPRTHHVVPPRAFTDFRIGEVFNLPSRTVTEANFAAFQVVSGDNHPIHYDTEYCRRQGHPGLLAHGLQVLCFSAAGAGLLPHVMGEALIGFIEQSSKFLKPVYAGDTLYPVDLAKPRKIGNTDTVQAADVLRERLQLGDFSMDEPPDPTSGS